MTVLEQILGHEVEPTIQSLIAYRLRSGCGPTGGELADYLGQTVEEFEETMRARGGTQQQSGDSNGDSIPFGAPQQ